MKINVNLIYVDLMKGEQKQDWFVKLNPQHCLPTINDSGFILWESRAIMTYFANCYAPDNSIYPSDPTERAIVDRLLQFDLNVLYRSLGEFLIPIVRENKVLTSLNPVKGRKVTEALTYLESVLAAHKYVAGPHLTLADFSIFYSMEFAAEFRFDYSKFTHIVAWYHRLKSDIEAIDKFMNYIVVRSVCNNNSNNSGTNTQSTQSTCEDTIGTCNLDKLCVDDRNQSTGTCGKVISRESEDCKVVTNYSIKQLDNLNQSQNLLAMLKNTDEKIFANGPK